MMEEWKNKWYAGTSGLVLPVPNKKSYPEEYREGTRLHYYASLFNTIEINSSFYRLPMRATVLKWANEVPDEFRFTFKFPSAVSHAPELQFDKEMLNRFMDTVQGLDEKKGCLLLQFPRKLTAAVASQLIKILEKIQFYDPDKEWTLAIEFRDISWYDPHIDELLKPFDAVRVIHDWHAFPTPFEGSSKAVYLRFHGPEKGYRGDYSIQVLKEYGLRIRQWLIEGKEVYAYFNNTLGAVIQNLVTLNNEVKK